MPTTYDLKMLFGASPGAKGREVLNHILRHYMPGFDAMLDVMQRLHEAQHGRIRPDPMLQDMLDALIVAKKKTTAAILSGRIVDGALSVAIHGGTHIVIRIPNHGSSLDDTGDRPVVVPQETGEPPADAADARVALLGTRPDTYLAAQWGLSHTAVAKMRRKHGIKSYCSKPRVDWDLWDDRLRRNSDMSPEGMAGIIGCDASTVRERTRYLQGAAGKYKRSPGRPPKGSEQAVDWQDVDWSLSDAEISRVKGVARQVVAAQRKRHAART